MKLPTYIKRTLLALGMALTLAFGFAGTRGVPSSEGITNFGKVNATLYRGAQPDSSAVEHLKALGVKTIINLRTPGDVVKSEVAEALASGLVYTNVPFAGMGRPTDEQVAIVLKLIEASPGPVYVHCKHGCDRTGTIIACYRITHDHWSGAAALEEAGKYGMSRLERGMRSYILDFARTVGAKTQQSSPGKH